MTRRAIAAPLFAALVVLLGCNTGPDCTADERTGLLVAVVEAGTDQPIVGAQVTIQDGQYTESRETQDNGAVSMAFERSGMYSMTVEKDGFITFEVDGIRVERGECHVVLTRVDVELEPVSEAPVN